VLARVCSRPGCSRAAVRTLTYDYGDGQMALGPLSPEPSPHGYDLCDSHVTRLTAPVGWELVRHEPRPTSEAQDLSA
jgi:Protein of unknown function (DUF3499)